MSITTVQENVTRLEHAVFGNGKDGLIVRLDRIEHAIRMWGRVMTFLICTMITAMAIPFGRGIVQSLFKTNTEIINASPNNDVDRGEHTARTEPRSVAEYASRKPANVGRTYGGQVAGAWSLTDCLDEF